MEGFNELPADAPARVQLIPAGEQLVGRDGRAWTWDAESWQLVQTNFAARGLPLAIDVNHSSERKAPKGEESPAYGWVQRIELVDGALFGEVEWTPRGLQAVKNREYRFLSPVFDYDRASGRIVRLTSVALVNEPNLRLPALNQVNRMAFNGPTAAAAAFNGLTAEESAVCQAIGVDPAAFLAAKAPEPAGPQRGLNAEAAFNGLTAAESAVCRATGVDPAAFLAAKAPEPAGPQRGLNAADAFNGLTAEESAVCRAIGLDPAAFLAAKQS